MSSQHVLYIKTIINSHGNLGVHLISVSLPLITPGVDTVTHDSTLVIKTQNQIVRLN